MVISRPWPVAGLDPLLHHPIRLFIMSALVTDAYYRFGYLCDSVAMPREDMNRHVARLRKAGYVGTTRGALARMWIYRTPLGRDRSRNHLAALHYVIESGQTLGDTAPPDAVQAQAAQARERRW